MTGIGVQSLLAVLIVLALVWGLAWLTRRGALGLLMRQKKVIAIETAVALGERRTLVIVSVEGRRLLLGLAPGHISMVTELGRPQPFDASLEAAQRTHESR